jgi:redox-sensing transcriptional repressor
MVANRNTIPRLCQYKNALLRFKELGFTKIFSEYLADATGSSGAVVRKDFSFFNITGKKRGGYEIDILLERIKTVLGKNKVQKVILAGAGNLGSALLKYKNFIKENISIEAAFDLDPAKVSRKSKIPVLPLVEMNDYIAANGIETGIITVPESSAQQVFDLMVSAIWRLRSKTLSTFPDSRKKIASNPQLPPSVHCLSLHEPVINRVAFSKNTCSSSLSLNPLSATHFRS